MKYSHPALRRWLMPLALPALIAGGVLWWIEPANSPATSISLEPGPETQLPSQAPALAAVTSDHQPPEVPAAVAYRTPTSLGAEPYAASLAGTDIDGALAANADGDLILNLATRDFFDYFLNTVGEVEPEAALDQIRKLAQRSLPASAVQQAMALLDQYLGYKQQALALQNVALDPTRQHDPKYQRRLLSQAFTDLKQLRQAAFSPQVHEAFFGLEEAYGEYTLASLEVSHREDLSAAAKQALMDWHRNQLPEALRATEQHLLASNQENFQRVQIIENAESPERAGQQLMAAGMPPEAAADVTQYLHDRQGFDDRYHDYRQEWDELNRSGLAAADKASQQTRLLDQYFPDPQQQTWARLKMLERDDQ